MPGLTLEGCRARQQRLREQLIELKLDSAVICDRRHVQYFCGYWHPAAFAAAALIQVDGPTLLVAPFPLQDATASDEVLTYTSNQFGTLTDDQSGQAVAALAPRISKQKRVGVDGPLHPTSLSAKSIQDILPQIYQLRRRKDRDEVAMIKRVIAATEKAYWYAYDHLRAGVDETDLFAGMLGAAAADCGEIIGEFGNDFQIGGMGGPPRRRDAQHGEMAIFDLSVRLRGYYSDMCRSFVVDREPNEAQKTAHERVLQVLGDVARRIKPGVSCKELFNLAHKELDGFRGWSFPHHLGHGVGLNGHEGPRLNPHWNDVLEPGNVIAVEPGLYGPDLRVGLRIEQIYLVTEHGADMLTSFPTRLG